mgnify:FL=1
MLPETQSKRTFVFRKYYEKYKHLWILLYFFVYMAWFNYVEKTVTTHFHVIHVPIDDYIPFCEYFVIPYLLWFPFVGWGIAYMALHNKTDYYKLCAFLFTGMTIFLIISTVYPNGQYLRPTYFTHHNLCTMLCERLYAGDTPTNLFPSVHVFNSIAVNIAVWHSDNFKKNKAVRYGSAVLMVLIILSTMFLKQHSVFDVVTGMVLAVFMYSVVYTTNWAAVTAAKPVRKPRRI